MRIKKILFIIVCFISISTCLACSCKNQEEEMVSGSLEDVKLEFDKIDAIGSDVFIDDFLMIYSDVQKDGNKYKTEIRKDNTTFYSLEEQTVDNVGSSIEIWTEKMSDNSYKEYHLIDSFGNGKHTTKIEYSYINNTYNDAYSIYNYFHYAARSAYEECYVNEDIMCSVKKNRSEVELNVIYTSEENDSRFYITTIFENNRIAYFKNAKYIEDARESETIFQFIKEKQAIIIPSDSDSEFHAIKITSEQLMNKISNGDDFVLVILANTCAHCREFETTINSYVNSGNTVYYIDLADTSDLLLDTCISQLERKLILEVPRDRGIYSLATPTSVYVEDGIFKDAIQGAVGMNGGKEYLVFCDVVEGKYVGKPVYSFD